MRANKSWTGTSGSAPPLVPASTSMTPPTNFHFAHSLRTRDYDKLSYPFLYWLLMFFPNCKISCLVGGLQRTESTEPIVETISFVVCTHGQCLCTRLVSITIMLASGINSSLITFSFRFIGTFDMYKMQIVRLFNKNKQVQFAVFFNICLLSKYLNKYRWQYTSNIDKFTSMYIFQLIVLCMVVWRGQISCSRLDYDWLIWFIILTGTCCNVYRSLFNEEIDTISRNIFQSFIIFLF
jgi:hypothetical protein